MIGSKPPTLGSRKPKKDLFMKLLLQRKSDLTYIVGAKCSDGVALIADKKITVDNGSDHFYDKKLFAPFRSLIIGSAGTTGLFTSFHNRLIKSLEESRDMKFRIGYDVGVEFKLRTERVIHEMRREYPSDVLANELQILMALRTKPIPELICFNGYGLGEPVSTYRAIGHGEPYGHVLLKNIWGTREEPLTMEQFARLGCLIISYIQGTGIDNSVGIDPQVMSPHRHAQVWYMPNVPDTNDDDETAIAKYPIKELTDGEVAELESASDDYLGKLDDAIHNITL